MQNRQCLIIEDDSTSAKILSTYIEKLPFFSVDAICTSYAEALEALMKQNYDLIFLDIILASPADTGKELSGLAILETFESLPPVIITSNYVEYAVESYRIGKSVDYLLKPFEFKRFLLAVNRALNIKLVENQIIDEKYIFLKMGRRFQRFNLDEVNYFEAYGIYLKVAVNDTIHVVNEIISGIEALLNTKQFVRVHKSYIINVNKIIGFDHNTIYLKHGKVPIGISYKPKLQGLLNLFDN